MANFNNLVQKAFYLGVGLASYASEQFNEQFISLRERAQKLADELVERGEMNSEEARRFVEDIMQQGLEKQQTSTQKSSTHQSNTTPSEPRRIEILDDDEEVTTQPTTQINTQAELKTRSVKELHDQVAALKKELEHLQNS